MIQKKAFLIFFLSMALNLLSVKAFSQDDLAAKADALFEQKDFVSAIKEYESLYAQGFYSEEMLYRMAFMYENMDEPAEAAYYLKKVQVEYGGKDLDARIRRLMRLAGTERFYTQDEWIAWSAFRRKWGWLINTLMCVGAVITAIGFLRPGFFRKPALRMARGFAGILLLVTCLLNSYHLFMSGDRAVVVKPTSFYREPGFASTSDPTTIGIGETVKVLGRQDIWVRIDAGGGDWWVPARVLRKL